MNISKEEFLKVYNKYKPNKLVVFMFKYFTIGDIKLSKKYIYQIIIILCFIIFNLISIIIDKKEELYNLKMIFLSLGNLPLLIVAILGLYSFIYNNLRIYKIRKELGITKTEYDTLSLIYFNDDSI
jgi:hypothetical protein